MSGIRSDGSESVENDSKGKGQGKGADQGRDDSVYRMVPSYGPLTLRDFLASVTTGPNNKPWKNRGAATKSWKKYPVCDPPGSPRMADSPLLMNASEAVPLNSTSNASLISNHSADMKSTNNAKSNSNSTSKAQDKQASNPRPKDDAKNSNSKENQNSNSKKKNVGSNASNAKLPDDAKNKSNSNSNATSQKRSQDNTDQNTADAAVAGAGVAESKKRAKSDTKNKSQDKNGEPESIPRADSKTKIDDTKAKWTGKTANKSIGATAAINTNNALPTQTDAAAAAITTAAQPAQADPFAGVVMDSQWDGKVTKGDNVEATVEDSNFAAVLPLDINPSGIDVKKDQQEEKDKQDAGIDVKNASKTKKQWPCHGKSKIEQEPIRATASTKKEQEPIRATASTKKERTDATEEIDGCHAFRKVPEHGPMTLPQYQTMFQRNPASGKYWTDTQAEHVWRTYPEVHTFVFRCRVLTFKMDRFLFAKC